jgi:hypothetical protein
LLATKQAIATHDWRIILQHGTELAVNTAWWMLIVTALVSAARSYGRRWLVAEPEPWVAALVFALGNLALCIVLQESAPRYGYFWFALGPAALFAVLSRWRTPAPAFALGVGLALSVGVAAPQAIAAAHAFSAQSIAQYRTIKRSARQLTALLATVSPGTTVYLVDDVLVNPTAPQFLQALSGFRGQLILVNSVDPTPGCTPSRPDEGRLGLIRVGAVTTLEYYSPPACFHAAWFPTLPGLVRDSIAQRGLLLSYSFPQITVRTRSLLTNRSEYVFGDHWTVRTAPPACAVEHECTWLGFDGAGPGYYKLDERAR